MLNTHTQMLETQRQMLETQRQMLETQGGLYNLGLGSPHDNLTKKVWVDYLGKLGHTPLIPKTLREAQDCLGKSSLIEIVDGLGQFVSSKDKFGEKLRIKDFYYFMLDTDRDLMGKNKLELPSYLGLLLLLEKTYMMNKVHLNFRQLSTGMMILSKTETRLDKITKQFRLLEPKKDWISEEKLYTILLGTFKLLCSMENETPHQPETSKRLADETTKSCLECCYHHQYHHHHHQYHQVKTITLDNWKSYCLVSSLSSKDTPTSSKDNPTSSKDNPTSSLKMTKHRASYLTNLDRFEADDVLVLFAGYCDEDGLINRFNYNTAFRKVIASKKGEISSSDRLEVEKLVNSIWDEYMVHDQYIDYTYLMTGLSVLTGSQRKDKIDSCFQLLATRQASEKGGSETVISDNDMKLYLTGVFKMLYLVQPDLRETMGVEPAVLASVTTEDTFNNPDLMIPGQLNLSEFRKWYEVESYVYPKKVVRKSDRTRRTPIRFSPC